MADKDLELVPLTEEEMSKYDFDLELINSSKSKHTVEEKVNCAALYATCGSLLQVSKYTGVDYVLLRGWKSRAPWWPDTIQKIRLKKQEELDGKMTALIDSTMEQLSDRVKDGEYVHNPKTDEITRVPMKSRDLAVLTGIIFDKRALIRGDATSISTTKTDSLKNVEAKMLEFADKLQGKTIEGEVVKNS